MSKKDRCSICSHKKRIQIDQCVTEGVSYRNIADRFKVGFQSVKRHVDNGHVAKDIEAAAIENGIDRGQLLQNKIDTAYNLALDAAKKAQKHDLRAFGGCISGVLKALEIEVRLTMPKEKNVNLLISDESTIDERLEALSRRRAERKASAHQ